MKYIKTARKKRFQLAVLTVLTAIVLTLTIALEAQTRTKRSELALRVDMLVSILAHAGYGGLIHNFKNYILRGEDHYFQKASSDASTMLSLIETYQEKKLSPEEADALSRVFKTVQEYQSKLETAQSRPHLLSRSSAALDRVVRVNDENAIQAISFLIAQLSQQKKSSEETSRIVTFILMASILAFAGIIGFLHLRDISQLEESTQKLKLANEELLQFSYRTSHDLKAPLTTIKGLSACILEDLDKNNLEEAKKNTESVITQSTRLEQLVTDILQLARMDVSELELEQLNLGQMLEEIEETHSHLLESNQVTFTKEVSLSREHFASKTRLYPILTNIIVNGIKYCDSSKERKFVVTRISDDRQGLLIQIEDNGIGIPTQEKNQIYEIFKKFHSDNSLGSGLGMHIVKKSILSMKGTIDYESSPKGTKFILRIPTAAALMEAT